MADLRPLFSVCIPAYNRSKYLATLLDSIVTQDFDRFNIVICEDMSPERADIEWIVESYSNKFPGLISYLENEENLGYDANIRRLVEKASGRYCFFMGNDDLMCPGALSHVAEIIQRHPDVGVVLKSYAWFHSQTRAVDQEIRYFPREKFLRAGQEAITVCFRRSGVISGYIVDRDAALSAATERFDGTLYYQLYLSSMVLRYKPAVFTPKVLVLCRGDEPPEFGNSSRERGKYQPGHYTPEARLSMVSGAVAILKDPHVNSEAAIRKSVLRDYANYFYPYVRDQLELPFRRYLWLYLEFAKLGFYRYPAFHLYCWSGYLLGQRRCDSITRTIRGKLGRTPQFGIMRFLSGRS